MMLCYGVYLIIAISKECVAFLPFSLRVGLCTCVSRTPIRSVDSYCSIQVFKSTLLRAVQVYVQVNFAICKTLQTLDLYSFVHFGCSMIVVQQVLFVNGSGEQLEANYKLSTQERE